MATTPRPSPTGAADPENGETAPGVGAPPQTAAAASAADSGSSTNAAGDDGADKVIHLADHQDSFGPIKIPDDVAAATDENGKRVEYTITRAGTLVKGAHVSHVRSVARHSSVALRSTKPKTNN